MDQDKVADLLMESLAELKEVRPLMREVGRLLVCAWRVAELEGHAYGPPLPEAGIALRALPEHMAPHLEQRLADLLKAQAQTNGRASAPEPAKAKA